MDSVNQKTNQPKSPAGKRDIKSLQNKTIEKSQPKTRGRRKKKNEQTKQLSIQELPETTTVISSNTKPVTSTRQRNRGHAKSVDQVDKVGAKKVKEISIPTAIALLPKIPSYKIPKRKKEVVVADTEADKTKQINSEKVQSSQDVRQNFSVNVDSRNRNFSQPNVITRSRQGKACSTNNWAKRKRNCDEKSFESAPTNTRSPDTEAMKLVKDKMNARYSTRTFDYVPSSFSEPQGQNDKEGYYNEKSRKKKSTNRTEKVATEKKPRYQDSELKPPILASHSGRKSNISHSRPLEATAVTNLNEYVENSEGSYKADEAMDLENPVAEILQMVRNTNQDLSGEDLSDAMDVDVMPLTVTGKQLVVIPDTNVWIENRAILDKILNIELEPDNYPVILIPWMVLQELDYNIHRNKNTNKGSLGFRNAAKYIHGLLTTKSSRVKGQKATEAVMSIQFNELNADDSILNCALQHSQIPLCLTVFLTNDVNLLNKALVHGLNAYKPEVTVIKTMQQICGNGEHTQLIDDMPGRNPSTPSLNSSAVTNFQPAIRQESVPLLLPVQDAPKIDHFYDMDVDDPMEGGNQGEVQISNNQSQMDIRVPVTFEDVVVSLKQALTNIIVPKMVEEYGQDDWKFAIKIKPPFSVESALRCMQLHWIAVFSFMFPNRGKDVVDELLDVFNKKPSDDHASVLSWRLSICRMALVLLNMNNKLVSRERISECCGKLKSFISRCEN